jgi:hypothetical protein
MIVFWYRYMHYTFHYKIESEWLQCNLSPNFINAFFISIVVLYHLFYNCYIPVFTSSNTSECCQSHSFMSVIRRHWLIYCILLLYINKLSLSRTNKEKNDNLIGLCSVTSQFVYQNHQDMIHYSSIIKDAFVYLFLSLFFTHFTMIYKKRTSPLLVKMAPVISRYGKTDLFETTYW